MNSSSQLIQNVNQNVNQQSPMVTSSVLSQKDPGSKFLNSKNPGRSCLLSQTSGLITGRETKLNDLLQYIYITLRSYPAPNIIIMKCEADSRILPCKLVKALSVKLNQDTMEIILALNKLNSETPNLILSYNDIDKLFNKYHILPIQKLDYSTTI